METQRKALIVFLAPVVANRYRDSSCVVVKKNIYI
jgi:hypothetical protein